jgi:4-alpha-glucanotransferase
LPTIAEDLGVITDGVIDLMEHCGFPGMKILQFAFDSGDPNDYVPHNYDPHSVTYTGTHDNDTIIGWASTASPQDREYAFNYLNHPGGGTDQLGIHTRRPQHRKRHRHHSDAGCTWSRSGLPDESARHDRWQLEMAP